MVVVAGVVVVMMAAGNGRTHHRCSQERPGQRRRRGEPLLDHDDLRPSGGNDHGGWRIVRRLRHVHGLLLLLLHDHGLLRDVLLLRYRGAICC